MQVAGAAAAQISQTIKLTCSGPLDFAQTKKEQTYTLPRHLLRRSTTELTDQRPPGLISFKTNLMRGCGVIRASPPMEPTVQPNGHVCATCGAVTGSPNAEPILSRSRLKLGLAWTSLAVGLFCGTPVFPQTRYTESP